MLIFKKYCFINDILYNNVKSVWRGLNEKLNEFLTAKKEEERKKLEAEKNETLIKLGLYEKVYLSSENENDDSNSKYFKKVAIEVTDEEYEEIKKYIPEKKRVKRNKLQVALFIVAMVVFAGGFLAGCLLGNIEIEKGLIFKRTITEFSFITAVMYWCIAGAVGTVLLAFSEVIKLLNDINNK